MTKHMSEKIVDEEVEVSESRPKKRKLAKKHKLRILIAVIVIILVLAGGSAWLYTGTLTSGKEKVFRNLPLPVAMVQSTNITSKQLFARVDLAKKVLEATGQPTTDITGQLLDQLIETKKINVVADNHKVKVSGDDLDNSYKAILKKFPDNDEQEFVKTLQENYGMDINTFKNEVVRQQVLQDNLKLWFAQQESLNNDQYNKARDLIKQLDSGTSFEEVAKKYSQDTASKEFAGDNGFVKYGDMLPEFKAAIKDLSVGNTKIVASRYGIHVIKVNGIEGDSANQDDRNYNLMQIFIQPADFSNWLKSQTDSIRAVKLL